MSTTQALIEPQVAVLDIVKKVSAIASLPEVTTKILAIIEDPRSTPAQLHAIISHDPALVTRILKVVNSAFYGLPGQIASVERAIVLLGLSAVKNLALAAGLGKLFKGVKLCDGFTARDLWTHCISVAVTARDLAKQMKVPLADEAFLAGIIHDVGVLIALQHKAEDVRQVCEQAKTGTTPFFELERQIMGMDHQQLGAALCEHWKFPRSCQLVAGYHHRPWILGDQSRLLVSLVYAADTLCCTAASGFNLTAMSQQLEEARLDEVGLEAPMIERTRQNLPTLISNAATLFD